MSEKLSSVICFDEFNDISVPANKNIQLREPGDVGFVIRSESSNPSNEIRHQLLRDMTIPLSLNPVIPLTTIQNPVRQQILQFHCCILMLINTNVLAFGCCYEQC